MNLILRNKKGAVVDVISNCKKVEKGKSTDYIGTNKARIGVRSGLFNEQWVTSPVNSETILTTINEQNAKRSHSICVDTVVFTIATVSEAPAYKGTPVGSRKEVNELVQQEIESICPPDKQLQMLTEKLAGAESEEWAQFAQNREKVLAEGRAFKDTHFPEK
jgi:hypothetical protein